MISGDSFASVAHRTLIELKKCSVRDAAQELGISPESLYARLYARTPFSAEEARLLIKVAPEPDLANCLLAFSPFFAAERLPQCEAPEETIHHGATRMVIEAADALRAVETALADGKIDHRERPIIIEQIEEVERALASLKRIASQP